MKNFLIFILAVVVIGGIVGYLSYKKQVQNAGNFDECTKIQGAVILESYPAQCRLGNKTFTQNIGNELEVKDLITISSPRPNQTISSPLNISGKARGTWFFEASFPIKLVGENGKTIAQTAAQAQGEWMTEEFVPYKAKLEFKTKAQKGTLILMKDNPSGLPENDSQLEVPLLFR